MSLSEPIRVIVELTSVLDDLGLSYVVGGSVASSLHGVPRSTEDIDLVVALPGRQVDALIARLEDTFYIDKDMVLDAIRRRASFNMIHLGTMYKLDIFIADRSELTSQEFARRQQMELGDPPQPVWICSPEDIVIQKLDWFKKGSQVSERQWQDSLGVLKVQSGRLDQSYLRHWAKQIGVEDLLDRALKESEVEGSD